MFSATLPPEALEITRKFMNKPVGGQQGWGVFGGPVLQGVRCRVVVLMARAAGERVCACLSGAAAAWVSV